jgi:hypothetical protein
MTVFLQLYLAHLLAEFILQPVWIGQNKGHIRILTMRAGIHMICACVTVNLGLNPRVLLAIVVLAVTHGLLDDGKARLSNDGWLAFSVGQAAHLGVVALASVWLTVSWAGTASVIDSALRSRRLYLYLVAYVAVVFGGGYLVQRVTQSFLDKMQIDLAALKPGLPSAGKYIGWVERFLILTFIVGGYDTAIGFLLAAKALARYPEIREDSKGHFAEYFLIGTLTSVGLALVAGITVKRLVSLLD